MFARFWIAAGVLVAAAVSPAAATFQVNYNFFIETGLQGSTAATVTDTVTPNATAGAIARGPGVAPSLGLLSISATGFSTSSSLNTANNDYFTFTVTPGSGTAVSLSSLTVGAVRSVFGPRNASLRTSLDGFATDVFSYSPGLLPGSTTDAFSGSYSGITTPVEFRIYAWNAVLPAGSLLVTNLTLNGTSAPDPSLVPAPSAALCMLLGTPLLGFARRFRRV